MKGGMSLALVAAAALAQTGPPDAGWGADRLAAALKSKDTAVAVEAAKALGTLTDSAVAFGALAAAVTDRALVAEVRGAALQALKERGDARATSYMLAALGDDAVGREAAEALRAFPSAELTAQLINILATDKKGRRRADAAYALTLLRDVTASQALTTALRDGDVEVRVYACAGVAALGDAAAVEPLVVNLKTDNHWRGRHAAAQALGAFKDPRAVKPLCERLADDRAEVRTAAAESLAALGDVQAMDPLRARLKVEKDDTARAAIARALEKLKEDVLKGVKIR